MNEAVAERPVRVQLHAQKPASAVAAASTFLLLAGVLQGLTNLALQASGRVTHLAPEGIWMAPLANLLIAFPLGLALAAIRRVRPGWLPDVRLAVITAFPAWLALVLWVPRVHVAAQLILACGLAVVTGRVVGGTTARLRRVVRVLLPLSVTAALLGALVLHGGRFLFERRRLAALPEAPADAPNVLLLILDTVRAASLSVYGAGRPTTPSLERLAQSSVTYDRAIAPAPWTLPSIATMLTGLWPWEHRADWTIPLDEKPQTLAGALSERGYVTGGFVGNLIYGAREWGLQRGFFHYEDYRVNAGEVLLASSLTQRIANAHEVRSIVHFWDVLGRADAQDLNRAFLHWSLKRERRPYFAMINYFDAHDPYLPPRRFEEQFAKGTPRQKNLIRLWRHEGTRIMRYKMEPSEIAAELAAYEAGITSIDEQVGVLLDSLDRRGELSRTIVVVVADHGEQVGEHGLFAHGNSLYAPLVHVPLLIRGPGAPAGVRIDYPVSLRDLPATILALAGSAGKLPGSNLLDSASVPRRSAALTRLSGVPGMGPRSPFANGDYAGGVFGDHAIIERGRGQLELYDLSADPDERHDLSGSAPALVQALRDSLRARRMPPARPVRL